MKSPRYRCNEAHEFDNPSVTFAKCKMYSAFFSESFTTCPGQVSRSILRECCPRYSDQLAMQLFDFDLIAGKLASEAPELYAIVARFASAGSGYLAPDDAGDRVPAEYQPTDIDERTRAMRQIAQRRGQQQFRDELRARHGDRCLICGCTVVDAIEAAHIRPYKGENDNHMDNGLLLRADLHTLFDLDLIGIHPQTHEITLSPDLKGKGYDDLAGRTLACGAHPPSQTALKDRWTAFRQRCTSVAGDISASTAGHSRKSMRSEKTSLAPSDESSPDVSPTNQS